MDDISYMASSSLLEEETICDSTTMEYSYYIPTVSFEEARFHSLAPTIMDDDDNDEECYDQIELQLATLPFQELMLCKSASTKAKTIKDYFYSYFSRVSFEEARFLHGPHSEYWKAKSESKEKAKKKKTARGNNNNVFRKIVMKNSMLKKGGIEAKVAKDVFVIKILKPPKGRHVVNRIRQFQIKASKSKLGPNNNCNAPMVSLNKA